MKNFYYKVNQFNEWLAVHATLVFGTMWMTYLFFLYGFLPIIFNKDMTTLLYWSNTVQLWSLPLLMVGQNVMGRSGESRAKQDHETLIAEFNELKGMHNDLTQVVTTLQQLVMEVHGAHFSNHSTIIHAHHIQEDETDE